MKIEYVEDTPTADKCRHYKDMDPKSIKELGKCIYCGATVVVEDDY